MYVLKNPKPNIGLSYNMPYDTNIDSKISFNIKEYLTMALTSIICSNKFPCLLISCILCLVQEIVH